MLVINALKFLFLFLLIVFISPKFTTSTSAQECITVTEAPNLFQVDRSASQATLFFTPVNTGISKYVITYGTSIGAEQHSISFAYGTSTGAVTYTINDLIPGIKYYFKVRAVNNCSSGPWSAWVGDTITPTPTGAQSQGMPVAGANDARNIVLISIPAILAGLYLLTRKNPTL